MNHNFEEKGEPKRGIEPASFRLPAERLTTCNKWVTTPVLRRLLKMGIDYVWETSSTVSGQGSIDSSPIRTGLVDKQDQEREKTSALLHERNQPSQNTLLSRRETASNVSR